MWLCAQSVDDQYVESSEALYCRRRNLAGIGDVGKGAGAEAEDWQASVGYAEHFHFLTQALNVIKETAPRRAFLTHMSHDIGLHARVCAALPDGVTLAYDGLTVDF